ncbi:hypothetical protein [Acinetobacter baumannii]|uniref:hypothetical protein n=1 Tax=Acinetobacter baumannii TaxID=470 RepID=UPI003F4C8736
MSVPEQIPYVGYVANGQTTEFPITFDLHDPEYLIVTMNKEIPVVGTYAVDMNALKVVFATAPTDGTQVELYRETELNRDTNYQKYDNSFRPEAVNYDFDKIWHVLQEQDMIDAELLARLKAEIEWRRTHDANFDELAKMRDAQIFTGLKQYIDTYIAATNPNIFEGITAGIVFALDKKSVQTHLENIYQELIKSNQSIAEEKSRAEGAEQELEGLISTQQANLKAEIQRAIISEAAIDAKVNANGVGNRAYKTYADMDADKANIPAKSKVTVTNDATPSNNGDWQWDGTTFTKSIFDPVSQAAADATAKANAAEANAKNYANNRIPLDAYDALDMREDIAGFVYAYTTKDGQLKLVGMSGGVQENINTLVSQIFSRDDGVLNTFLDKSGKCSCLCRFKFKSTCCWSDFSRR